MQNGHKEIISIDMNDSKGMCKSVKGLPYRDREEIKGQGGLHLWLLIHLRPPPNSSSGYQ